MERRAMRHDEIGAKVAQAGPWAACGVALLAVAAGLLARWQLDPLLAQRATFLLFVPAVVMAAAMAGLWPGLFATAIGAVAGRSRTRPPSISPASGRRPRGSPATRWRS